MSSKQLPITQWIESAKHGDMDAINALVSYYHPLLLRQARLGQSRQSQGVADAEDHVQRACISFFCRMLPDRKYDHLQNRDQLQNLLQIIINRRASNHDRRERAQKRGAGTTVSNVSLDNVANQERAVDLVVAYRELIDKFRSSLDEESAAIFDLRFQEGHNKSKIAELLGCRHWAITRKLHKIGLLFRDMFADEFQEELDRIDGNSL